VARAGRWFRRNRLVASSLSLAFISLAAFTAGSIWFALNQKKLKAAAELDQLTARYETNKVVMNYKLLSDQKLAIQEDYFNEIQTSRSKFKELIQAEQEKLAPKMFEDLYQLNCAKWLESAQKLYNDLENDFTRPELNLQLAAFIAEMLKSTGQKWKADTWQERVIRQALNYPKTEKISHRTLGLIVDATLEYCSREPHGREEISTNAELASRIYQQFNLDRLQDSPSEQIQKNRASIGKLVEKLESLANKGQVIPGH
jgi:hypothetical protein